MRSKRHCVAGAVALVLLAIPCAAADTPKPFALKNVIGPSTGEGQLTVLVSTTGTPLDQGELETTSHWRLGIVTDDEGSRPVTLDRVVWDAGTKVASLVFPRSATYGVDLSGAGWVVAFVGTQVSTASVDAPSSARFKAAKGKDDASVYAFGSMLVGPSTKPLYVIDLKLDYKSEFGTSGWLWNAGLTANTNTDAEPPVDKVRIDPDSITTLFSLTKRHKVTSPWVNALKYTLAPIQGEFTRKDGVADAVTTGGIQIDLKPIARRLTVYPSVGYEVGHAIKKPDTISDQPVNLADWNWIGRGVLGISSTWTLFKAQPTDDDWYIVTVTASYAARLLAAAEPFAKPGVVDGARAVVTTVNQDVRHHAEAELDWNVLKYTSVSLKYQYGAVPPLFQLVDHQVTIGITVKAAQK